MLETRRQIRQENLRRLSIPISHKPSKDELCVRANRNPCPEIPIAKPSLFFKGKILLGLGSGLSGEGWGIEPEAGYRGIAFGLVEHQLDEHIVFFFGEAGFE